MKNLKRFAKHLCLMSCLGILTFAFAQDSETEALRSLALRILGGVDTTESTANLLTAQIPPDLPFDLALMQGAALLGSYVRRNTENKLQAVQIVLDIQKDMETSLNFYDTSLRDQGWIVQLEPQAFGFVDEANLFSAMYCDPEGQGFTYVTAFQVDSQSTDLHFNLYLDSTYNACQDDVEPVRFDIDDAPLPLLLPPRNSDITPLSKLLVVEPLSLSVLLSTPLSQAEVLAHYEAQLGAAGWQQLSDGESGGLSFGRWIYTDNNGLIWTSILTIMDLGVENEFYASVIVLLPIEATPMP